MPQLMPKGGLLPPGMKPKGSLTNYTPTLREKIISKLARGWYGDTRQGYGQAERLMGVADYTPVGAATTMYDAGRAFGQGNTAQAGIMAAMAGLPIPGALKKETTAAINKGIKAYHGSPHSFDKFDINRIGTGEGAQAYGHGLYFAEAEGTSKAYRENLSRGLAFEKAGKPIPFGDFFTELEGAAQTAQGLHRDQAHGIAKQISDMMDSGKSAKYIRKNFAPPRGFENAWNSALDAATAYKKNKNPGHMYEVNIDADPEQFLDWDKPLSEQPENVRALAKNWGISETETYQQLSNKLGGPTTPIAKPVMGSELNDSLGTEKLKAAGIPGIKYLDAGSRAKGDGSRNYVVFDDKLVKIMRKYGLGGLIGAGAAGAAMQQPEQNKYY